MSISMYQASVPVFNKMLSNLKAILDKGSTYTQTKKIDQAALLNARLYPDMFPLTRQVQIASDFAKGSSARLAGLEVPKFEDNETSFQQLQARIDRTLDFISSIKAAQIDGSEERVITIPIRGEQVSFKGIDYLLHQALPNFYFHLTTAYAILRHNGVEVGKRDFIGKFD